MLNLCIATEIIYDMVQYGCVDIMFTILYM